MAKYRRIRRYRKKGRWSANIKTISSFSITAPSNSTFYGGLELCQNPVQNEATVSQQFTVKNVELSFDIDNFFSGVDQHIEALTAYIMFIPQGFTITETLPNSHPEWIMAYRYYGKCLADDSYNTLDKVFKIKTRLSRRLQTGDKLILLITGNNDNTEAEYTLNLHGMVRWWTKAN